MVIAPLLLRPPVFFRILSRDFSGLLAVISSKPGASLCLVPGVTGLSFLNAILSQLNVTVKIYHIALFEGYDRLLVVGLAALQHASFRRAHFQLAHGAHRVDALH